jgi:CubicO group peptidase (beta-lactamase class C family)
MVRSKVIILLATTILLCCSAVRGKDYAGNTVVDGELGKKLDQFLGALADWGLSGAVLVAKNDHVVLAKGYGLADREKKIPFTPATVVSVGSITKQFTAAAILKLKMQGKLQVTDPIGKYLPGVPADKAAITLHHLLTHSSGLESDFGGDFEKVNRDEIIKRALASKLRTTPGQRYHYANAGYSLLAAIVETVSGQNYEAYLHENLFVPAGMNQTGYQLAKWRQEDIAQGYQHTERYGTILERPWAADGPYWNLRGNGGIHSTLGDMYRWHLALEGDKILSSAERDKLFTPHVSEGGGSHYGYGWSVAKTRRGTRLIGHNGSDGIFYAECRRYLDDGVFVYLETNLSELANDRLGRWIDRVIFGGDYPTPPRAAAIDVALLPRYAGTYQLGSGGKLILSVKDGRLAMRAEGPGALALLAAGRKGDAAALAALSARTAAILEARDSGDYGPLLKAFGGRMSLDQLKQVVANALQEQQQEHGTYHGFDVIGSIPSSAGNATYVRMRFARGTTVARYQWQRGQLLGVRVGQAPPTERTFLPQSATEFAAFSFDFPENLVIRFSTAADGTVTGLTFHGKDGDESAKKVEAGS